MRAGIDLGGTKIEGIILNDAGVERARRRIAAPKGDYSQTIAAIRDLITALQDECGPITHVGVGIPGCVSPATGLVKNANSTWLIGHPFDKDLEQALDRPVRLANDANCFTVSEATDGAGQGASVVFGVILGTGVGGGIAVDGHYLTGLNAIAGEWGHNPLPWPKDDERPGPDCYCGLAGCIETFLSGPGIERDHHAASGENVSASEIAANANADSADAAATLDRYENRLARALASVINIIDPEVIVLGGGLSNVSRLYDNVPKIWDRWVFSDSVDTRLVQARHGDSSGVRGAAWLWPGNV